MIEEEDAEEQSAAHWDNMIVFLNGVVAALKAENLSYPLICPTCDGAGDIVTKLGESTGEYMDDRIVNFPEYAPCEDCQSKGFLIKKALTP